MKAVQPRTNPILRAAFPILVVFLFAVFTGLPEMVGFLRPFRPMLVLGALGLVVVATTGRFRRVVTSSIGKVLVVFTLWFLICIPMAIWHGGSFGVFVDSWAKSFLAYVLTAGLISTAAQEKKIFHTIAYAVGMLACMVLVFRNYDVEGRLSMRGGRYGNANDLAWTLLIGLIFLGFLYLRGGGSKKLVAVFLMLPVLLVLAKTGSRSAVLGAGMLAVFVFFQVKASTRLGILLATPVLLVALIMAVPNQLRDRYTTLFKAESSSNTQLEASGSSQVRLRLLKDSIIITFRHPLFGVGPGNFVVEQEKVALARGDPYGLWRVTHNSYTQLSSEMGIPGLLIYLVFLFRCWKVLTSIIRRRRVSKDLMIMAQTLRAALVVLATVAFFDSYAYDVNVPMLAGLITALSFIAQAQRAGVKTQSKGLESAPSQSEPDFEPAWSGSPY